MPDVKLLMGHYTSGKFQEDWESMDGMYVLQQLGALPTTQPSDK
jgi:hypothetical protein